MTIEYVEQRSRKKANLSESRIEQRPTNAFYRIRLVNYRIDVWRGKLRYMDSMILCYCNCSLCNAIKHISKLMGLQKNDTDQRVSFVGCFGIVVLFRN